MTFMDLSHQISSVEFDQTTITAHLEAEIVAGENLVYCAAFQLAWNQLTEEIVGGPLQLEGDPPIAQALNKRLLGEQSIAEDCYLAMAGFGRDGIVEQIEQELQAKFDRSPELDLTLDDPNSILAYAFLEKSLPFDKEFEVFDAPLVFSDGVEVQSFGIQKDDTPADQVVVLDYLHPDDFVLRLQASEQVSEDMDFGWKPPVDRPRITDDIILAKVTPQATLAETIDAVMARTTDEARKQAERAVLQAGGNPLKFLSPRVDPGKEEVLQIPKIEMNVWHSYDELVSRRLLNEGFRGHYIAEALQAIKFKLDEKGADLSSEASIKAYIGIFDQPRSFVFDQPFLLCLKEKEARYPYLAMWIADAELLVKA
jgi:hypothetical protein